MKILVLSHMYPNRHYPSFGIFVQEQARQLQRHVDLEVVSPVPWFPFSGFIGKYKHYSSLDKEECFNGIKVYRPRYFLIPKIFKFLDYYLYLYSLSNFISKIIIDNDYDVIHSHWGYPDGLAGLVWSVRHKKKCILTIHGNESICYFENSLRKKMVTKRLKYIDHIITVSNDLKRKITNDYSVPENQVSVISNGIDRAKFYQIDRTKARETCGLNVSKKCILSVCRLSPEKGIEYLLHAFSMMSNDDTQLIIIGDGPLRSELIKLSINLRINSKTIFINAINHDGLYKYYNAADVFCLPSLWEGSPCTIIESMACGTPIVSTNVGGIPDIVSSECGLVVTSKNVQELQNALQYSLNKPWDRAKISFLSEQYAWTEVTKKLSSLYERLFN